MKIGPALNYEVPDDCPEGCAFTDDFMNYGQNAMCMSCPVFSCTKPKACVNEEYEPLVPADQFRSDWAREWEKFFATGELPKLKIIPSED